MLLEPGGGRTRAHVDGQPLDVVGLGRGQDPVPGRGRGAGKGSGGGSFFSGIFAAAVATPCTAPFMAFALGAALVMPWPMAMAVLGRPGAMRPLKSASI